MRWLAIWCGVVLTIFSSAGLAAAPEETFEKVYGEQAKKVIAQRDAKASGEFAQSLVKDAAELKDDADFQALVFTKAYDIALRASAFAIAEDAMEKLAGAQPARRRVADEKLIVALEREHKPANRAKLDATKARVLAAKKLEQLEHGVEKTPNKKDAAEIVRLLLVEFDDPAKAATFAPATGDAALQSAVELAGKNVGDLPERSAKELGDWYQARLSAASPSGRAVAGLRAASCYERFLSLHTANDASRLEAKRHLDAIAQDASQENAKAGGIAGGHIIDLLKLIDLPTDVVAAKWERVKDGIQSSTTYAGRIRIPYEPPAEYDIRIIFTTHADVGMTGLIVAHNKATVFWRVDWAGDSAFVESSLPSPTKGVQLEKPFANGSKHEAIIKVRNASLTAIIDGKQMNQYVGEYSQAKVSNYWSIGDGAIGLASQLGAATYHNVDLAEVSGHGKPSPKVEK